ncbi:cytochrome P450 [Streptomyces decoyicus]|uniref:cytochrome P450 n=1 Tax=Streptomyces decoyicus TaxID=249567 RepID=UPI0038705A2B|nr:cytochrome P450 [Streptomyces decoyicus]
MTRIDTTATLPSLQDLLDPRHQADPYPLYARWRTRTPIARIDDQLMVLSRYEDCAAVLRDGRFGHAEADDPRFTGERVRPASKVLVDDNGRPVRGFLSLNPPDHTRMRGLVSQAFTRRRVDRLAPRIEELATELFTGLESAEGPVDLIEDLASPLPVAVISELLGVPTADRHRMLKWSHAVARALVPDFLLPPGAAQEEAQAWREFTDYLRELAAERRRAPGDDLLSALVAVHDDGDALSENELLATCTLLLIAGHETTVNLIGNGTLALLRHPDQLARLRSDPDLIEPGVEELLRYDSPVQLIARFALQDADVAEVPVTRGTTLLLLAGAANRDPDAYDHPDRLDVGRTSLRHLSFGHGIHFCLGAPLARLETQIVLRMLLRRAPDVQLAGEPRWKDHITLRGLSRLPLSLG